MDSDTTEQQPTALQETEAKEASVAMLSAKALIEQLRTENALAAARTGELLAASAEAERAGEKLAEGAEAMQRGNSPLRTVLNAALWSGTALAVGALAGWLMERAEEAHAPTLRRLDTPEAAHAQPEAGP